MLAQDSSLSQGGARRTKLKCVGREVAIGMIMGSPRSRRDWPLTFAMTLHSPDKIKIWKDSYYDSVKQDYQSSSGPSLQLITKTFVEKASKVVIPLFLLFFLLLLLVWDMKTTSTLSEIIHDDHADRWEPMDPNLLGRWFSPLDLCMLKVDKEDEDIRSYRMTNCSKLLGEQRLFCGIGSSLGKSCLAPLSTRSFFTSRLIGRMGDPDNRLLKNSLRQLAKQKKAVVFVGDVISKQNQEAMVCELLRTDRITFTGGPRSGADSTISKFGISWKDRPDLSLEIIFMHLAHLMDHDGHRHRRRLNNDAFVPPETKPKFQAHLEINDNSSVYAQNGPSMNLISLKSHIDELSLRYPAGIVVIANIGVWYNSREKYRKELPTFLRWLDNLGKRKRNIILFRETAAQHWNHTGDFKFLFLHV